MFTSNTVETPFQCHDNETLPERNALELHESCERVEPLYALRISCLQVLDLLLRNLAVSHTSHPPATNTLSHSILGSARHLREEWLAVSDSDHNIPSVEALSDVGSLLRSLSVANVSLQDTIEFSLAYALFHLSERIRDLYAFISPTALLDSEPTVASTNPSLSGAYQQLLCEIAACHDQYIPFDHHVFVEWVQVQALMDAVCQLIQTQQRVDNSDAPPAYSSSDNHRLPRYSSSSSLAQDPCEHLESVLSAIDRLGHHTPRFDEQRASISVCTNESLPSPVGKAVERLSRGRLEDQRASLPPVKTNNNALQDLIPQIEQLAAQTMDDQRAQIPPRLQKRIEEAAVSCLLDRMDRARLNGQDWLPPKQQPLCLQRFRQSVTKECDFLASLFKKASKLEKRRLANQNAVCSFPNASHCKDTEELSHLFDRMGRTQLQNQRASFRSNSCSLVTAS